jgi:hypothetical protein
MSEIYRLESSYQIYGRLGTSSDFDASQKFAQEVATEIFRFLRDNNYLNPGVSYQQIFKLVKDFDLDGKMDIDLTELEPFIKNPLNLETVLKELKTKLESSQLNLTFAENDEGKTELVLPPLNPLIHAGIDPETFKPLPPADSKVERYTAYAREYYDQEGTSYSSVFWSRTKEMFGSFPKSIAAYEEADLLREMNGFNVAGTSLIIKEDPNHTEEFQVIKEDGVITLVLRNIHDYEKYLGEISGSDQFSDQVSLLGGRENLERALAGNIKTMLTLRVSQEAAVMLAETADLSDEEFLARMQDMYGVLGYAAYIRSTGLRDAFEKSEKAVWLDLAGSIWATPDGLKIEYDENGSRHIVMNCSEKVRQEFVEQLADYIDNVKDPGQKARLMSLAILFNSSSTANEKLSEGAVANLRDGYRSFVTAAASPVTGIYQIAAHPVETADGIAFIIDNPDEAWNAIKQQIANMSTAEAIGFSAGLALSIVGGGALLRSVSTAGKTGQAAQAGSRAGQAGAKAVQTGRLTEGTYALEFSSLPEAGTGIVVSGNSGAAALAAESAFPALTEELLTNLSQLSTEAAALLEQLAPYTASAGASAINLTTDLTDINVRELTAQMASTVADVRDLEKQIKAKEAEIKALESNLGQKNLESKDPKFRKEKERLTEEIEKAKKELDEAKVELDKSKERVSQCEYEGKKTNWAEQKGPTSDSNAPSWAQKDVPAGKTPKQWAEKKLRDAETLVKDKQSALQTAEDSLKVHVETIEGEIKDLQEALTYAKEQLGFFKKELGNALNELTRLQKIGLWVRNNPGKLIFGTGGVIAGGIYGKGKLDQMREEAAQKTAELEKNNDANNIIPAKATCNNGRITLKTTDNEPIEVAEASLYKTVTTDRQPKFENTNLTIEIKKDGSTNLSYFEVESQKIEKSEQYYVGFTDSLGGMYQAKVTVEAENAANGPASVSTISPAFEAKELFNSSSDKKQIIFSLTNPPDNARLYKVIANENIQLSAIASAIVGIKDELEKLEEGKKKEITVGGKKYTINFWGVKDSDSNGGTYAPQQNEQIIFYLAPKKEGD